MNLEQTLTLIIIFILGCFLKKMHILSRNDANIFGKLLANLVIPAVIINSFSTVSIDYSLISLPIAAVFVVSALVVVGYLIGQSLDLRRETRGAFITAFPTLEGGTIGYVFMLSIFGEVGLNRIVLFDLANIILLFTVVQFCSCFFGNGGVELKQSLLKIAKTPLIWASMIGLFLNIAGLHHGMLSHLFHTIGDSVLLLIMLMLGLTFQFDRSCLKLSSITIMLKTATGLVLGCLATLLFGLSGVERVAVIVGSSLPPSMLTLVFAEENNLDTRYVANLLSTALPFALLFLPILINFL